jgi:3-oxoadipate enol-lactonase
MRSTRRPSNERPAVLAFAGTMLDPFVVFEGVAAPHGVPFVPFDWLPLIHGEGLLAARDQVARALVERGGEPVILVGHSSGGVLALLLALAVPDHVAGILTINTGANTRGHGDVDAPKRFDGGIRRPEAERFLTRCFATPLGKHRFGRLVSYALAADPLDVVAAMTSQRQLDVAPELGRIARPVAALHGTRDLVRGRRHAEEIANGVQDGTLEYVACGHTAPVERPEVVSRAIGRLSQRAWKVDHPG